MRILLPGATGRTGQLLLEQVRPVFLTNSKKRRNVIVHNNSNPRLFIGRKNLAGFMLDVVEKNLYRRESPQVSEGMISSAPGFNVVEKLIVWFIHLKVE